MGWWQQQYANQQLEVGDEPLDLAHEMVRQIQRAYEEDVERKPTLAELVWTLERVLMDVGREACSDLAEQEVVALACRTRKARRMQKSGTGDCFVVPLQEGKFAYGRILEANHLAGDLVELYDLQTDRPLTLAELEQRRPGVLFTTQVSPAPAFKNFRWRVLGRRPLPKGFQPPLVYRLGHGSTGYYVTEGKKRRAITPQQAMRLEPCTSWSPEAVEDRLTSGHPDHWPELEEFLCTDFGDVYLKQVREPERLKRLYLFACEWCPVTLDGLKVLQRAVHLEELSLHCPEVTDRELGFLTKTKHLWLLDLSGCSLTDRGLRQIATLTGLRLLRLRETKLTDAGLALLATLPALEEIDVCDTDVTASGVAALQQQRPRLKIKH